MKRARVPDTGMSHRLFPFARIKIKSAPLRRLRHTHDSVRPPRSRKAAARIRHFPTGAATLGAPEKSDKASAALRRDIRHHPRAVRSLQSFRSAAHLPPAQNSSTLPAARNESPQLYRSAQTPAHLRIFADSPPPRRTPERSQYTNAHDKK